MNLNNTSEEKLINYLEKDRKGKCFSKISLEALEQYNVQELHSFILTQSHDMQKLKVPKNGKLNGICKFYWGLLEGSI